MTSRSPFTSHRILRQRHIYLIIAVKLGKYILKAPVGKDTIE